MNDNPHLLPNLAAPILENDNFIIRQDVEWPLPGFYIVSVRDHIGSISDLSLEKSNEFFTCLYYVRKGLKDIFNLKRAQVYHEEKLKTPHLHFWVLPLWEDVLEKQNINPRIYEANILKYLESFSYSTYKETIAECNIKMSDYLSKQHALVKLGFKSNYNI